MHVQYRPEKCLHACCRLPGVAFRSLKVKQSVWYRFFLLFVLSLLSTSSTVFRPTARSFHQPAISFILQTPLPRVIIISVQHRYLTKRSTRCLPPDTQRITPIMDATPSSRWLNFAHNRNRNDASDKLPKPNGPQHPTHHQSPTLPAPTPPLRRQNTPLHHQSSSDPSHQCRPSKSNNKPPDPSLNHSLNSKAAHPPIQPPPRGIPPSSASTRSTSPA